MAQHLFVTPNHWTPRGEVVCEEEGRKPLLVSGGIPDELCEVELMHRGQNQLQARWFASEAPSPYRVTPPCEKYRTCGGCPLMHVNEAGQERARRFWVRDAFAIEHLEVELGEYHASPEGSKDFRRVIKVGFENTDHGRLRMGAWGRRTRRIVAVPDCVVAAPVLNRVMKSLAHHAIELGLTAYDPYTEEGVLRAAVLRSSRSTGKVMITLVAARRERKLGDLAEAVAAGVAEVAGVWVHQNTNPGNAIFDRGLMGEVGVKRLAGTDTIEETLGDVTYRVGPGDFFQTNPGVAEIAYQRVIERLELTANDAVVDLYCGVGGIALQAAKQAGFVIGVEEIDGAITRAKEAARSQRLNAEFVGGRVNEVLPEVLPRVKGAGAKVVVDPARRGLEPGVMDMILAMEPSRLAYVSCNPRTLARDVRPLLEAGWTMGPLELFDMFPHTAHVEVLAVLDPPVAPQASRRAPKRKLAR